MTRARKCRDRVVLPQRENTAIAARHGQRHLPPLAPRPIPSSSLQATFLQTIAAKPLLRTRSSVKKAFGGAFGSTTAVNASPAKEKIPLAHTSHLKTPKAESAMISANPAIRSKNPQLTAATNQGATESGQDSHDGTRFRNRRRRADVNVVEQNVVVPDGGGGRITLETHTEIVQGSGRSAW